jgi:hypothetical protein
MPGNGVDRSRKGMSNSIQLHAPNTFYIPEENSMDLLFPAT